MLTKQGLDRAVANLSLMGFFPSNDVMFRAALIEELALIAHDDERLLWLAKRTLQLFKDWPGIYEVRAVYSSRYTPKDGSSVDSIVYFSRDGIPSEHPEPQKVLPPPQSQAQTLTADPEMRKTLGLLKGSTAMPELRRGDFSRATPTTHATSFEEAGQEELHGKNE